MHFIIYQITNIINNKTYIGKHQTNDIQDSYMGSGKLLSRAIRKHGMANFTKQVLHIFDTEEDMNRMESELVTEAFCERADTYNLCPGGHGGFGYINSNGLAVSLTQQRIRDPGLKLKTLDRAKDKIQWLTENDPQFVSNRAATARKMHESGRGRVPSTKGLRHSVLTKDKMSKSATGSSNSQFGSKWYTDGVVNKKIAKADPVPDGFYAGRSATT
jgi:hypothetical protein